MNKYRPTLNVTERVFALSAFVAFLTPFLAYGASPQQSTDILRSGARMTLKTNDVEFAFRYCPPGKYLLGSPSDEIGRFRNESQREVEIKEGFWIAETETTQKQWIVIMGDDRPVENVSFNVVDDLIQKLNELGSAPVGWEFEIPTEDQWEYACRANTTGPDYSVVLDDCAWYWNNSGEETYEVGRKRRIPWACTICWGTS